MPESVSFGTWLRQRRRALDLTQKSLAEQVGCAEITVRRMEADQYKPSSELAYILLEKLGISEPDRSQWVRFARGLAGFPDKPVLLSPSLERLTNLPVPLTSFIGHEKDVALIQQRLAEHRLVTLIGAGGIGKTRLSQYVAGQLVERYSNGVWLVELASLNDPAFVSQTVAAVFGIRPGTDRVLIETLIHFLRAKATLLILDNCEHLLDACAGLADRLLKNCPNLKILATSREALGIIGEALYQVPALTIPEIHSVETIENLNEYESIRLFEERARLVQLEFALTKENAYSVAQICCRLDGIPLAIELAAVRIQSFSAAEIARQLDQCFQLLTVGSRTALPRHQTLQACIDWSWHLLYDSEQTVLRRLSVFAGGFTLEAAEQVCAEDGIEPRQISGVISQLVMKSLVVENQDSGRVSRYHLLETIRQYAREKLVESGEEENIHTQHLKFFLELSEQIERGLQGPQQMEWFVRTKDELDNLRAALGHAAKTDLQAGLNLLSRLAGRPLGQFWESYDMREGARWLIDFIQKPEAKKYPLAKAKALHEYGWLMIALQQFTQARSAAHECLTLFRACKNQHGEVDALLLLGYVIHIQPLDDLTQPEVLWQEAHNLAQSLGDSWRRAMSLQLLGWRHRDWQRSFTYWEEAIDLFRDLGDWSSLAYMLSTLGLFRVLHGDFQLAQKYLDEAELLLRSNQKVEIWQYLKTAKSLIALMRGDYELAHALLQKVVLSAEETGDRMNHLWARVRMGYVALREGNPSRALEIFAETAHEFLKDKNEMGVAFTLEGMADLYVVLGKNETSARLIGWADTAREKIGDMRPLLEQADVDKNITACLVKLGEEAFREAYEEGKKMSLDEVVAYALRDN